jgi:hypothetical protein
MQECLACLVSQKTKRRRAGHIQKTFEGLELSVDEEKIVGEKRFGARKKFEL